MKVIIRRMLVPTIAGISLLATAIPVHAGSAYSVTGGCDAMGTSDKTGSLVWGETDANPYGGCNNTFVISVFDSSNGNSYPRGPGWNPGSHAFADDTTVPGTTLAVTSTHNLCQLGGPCGGSLPWGTTWF